MTKSDGVQNMKFILNEVKENYSYYIGYKSLIRLEAFINGLIISEKILSNKKNNKFIFFPGFNEWVCNKFSIENRVIGWCKIITLYSSTDCDAFDKFYDVLDEFYLEFDERVGDEKVISHLINSVPELNNSNNNIYKSLEFDIDKYPCIYGKNELMQNYYNICVSAVTHENEVNVMDYFMVRKDLEMVLIYDINKEEYVEIENWRK